MKKITAATFKSFVKKNSENLLINVKSEFDGMVDGCVSNARGFRSAKKTDLHNSSNLGFEGIWLVGSARNWFEKFENETMTGIEVSNCCGNFIVAVAK